MQVGNPRVTTRADERGYAVREGSRGGERERKGKGRERGGDGEGEKKETERGRRKGQMRHRNRLVCVSLPETVTS